MKNKDINPKVLKSMMSVVKKYKEMFINLKSK
jgi:hypothetical protein